MKKFLTWLLIGSLVLAPSAVFAEEVEEESSAADLLHEVEEEAESLLAEAESGIEEIAGELESEAGEIAEEIESVIEEAVEEIGTEAEKIAEEIESVIEEIASEPETEAAPEETAEPVYEITFEDEKFGFLGLDSSKGNADASELSVVDFGGSKALKVAPQGKVPYVALNVEGLLGENLPALREMRFDIGLGDTEDGKFYAVSGNIYTYSGEDKAENKAPWSVYMKNKNPKTASLVLTDDTAFVPGAGNYLMISKEVDNSKGDPQPFYIDHIQFFDADGKALPIDLSAEYVAESSEKDLSNLAVLVDPVEFEGFTTEGTAWGQNGFEMPQEFLDALVPGSVIEIEYASGDGSMWIVMPWAEAGWMRVADGGKAAHNNTFTIAQITYEQIEELCGEDKSTWGAMLQCEASADWKVYALRVGQRAEQIVLGNPVEFEGFSVSGDAWGQNGLEMPQEIVDALVPGSVVEIDFESEDGTMWLVMPWAEAGWSRVADNGGALIAGGKAYVTYEQIEAVCGEDKATWGAMMQCEASSPWQVYSVKVGEMKSFKMLSGIVELPGFDKSAGAWAQDGVEMTEEFLNALVPGSVISVAYESEDGSMWIVMPWAEAGWIRVGDGGKDVANGTIAQITYEQIEELCGEDKATWGAMLQCEASAPWHVYSVAVGQALELPGEEAEQAEEPAETEAAEEVSEQEEIAGEEEVPEEETSAAE